MCDEKTVSVVIEGRPPLCFRRRKVGHIKNIVIIMQQLVSKYRRYQERKLSRREQETRREKLEREREKKYPKRKKKRRRSMANIEAERTAEAEMDSEVEREDEVN